MRDKKNYFLFFIFAAVFFISAQSVSAAWTNTSGGDHEGADWTPANLTNISGVHYNIGSFVMSEMKTASVRNISYS